MNYPPKEFQNFIVTVFLCTLLILIGFNKDARGSAAFDGLLTVEITILNIRDSAGNSISHPADLTIRCSEIGVLDGEG